MKWVTMAAGHINTEHVTMFAWSKGLLTISCVDGSRVRVPDPDKAQYMELCKTTGVEPCLQEEKRGETDKAN